MEHFLSLHQTTPAQLSELLQTAKKLKALQKKGITHRVLEGKTLGMLFQKPSNRTRVSFEVAMYQLGGHALNLQQSEIGLKERESVADVAQVMARYVDAMMLRVMEHCDIEEFARYSDVPIINGLSDRFHPCQAVADALTILEKKGRLSDIRLTYIGDGNNVCASLINVAALCGMQVSVCCPEGYEPQQSDIISDYTLSRNPKEAVAKADVIYTDVWTSMGQEAETALRKEVFAEFSVTQELFNAAPKTCIFMHCLPAHRGEEVDAAVLLAKRCVVIDQAENRLHAQKAILCHLLDAEI